MARLFERAGEGMISLSELAKCQSSLGLSLMAGWVVGDDLVIKQSLVLP